MPAPGKPPPHEPDGGRRVGPRMARAMALVLALSAGAAIYWNDRYLTGAHAMAVTAAIAALLAFATRRALLSAMLATTLVAFVLAVAFIKRAPDAMSKRIDKQQLTTFITQGMRSHPQRCRRPARTWRANYPG